MSHWSESSTKLDIKNVVISQITELKQLDTTTAAVYFLWLPALESTNQSQLSNQFISGLSDFCSSLHSESVVCIFTSPSHAASVLPHIEGFLKFQLWIAVKTCFPDSVNSLQRNHTALLVLTRYVRSLKHTKTRIQYTYCPACNKTTKDYGGKKHTYHEYGTLVSDIWRDIEFIPEQNVNVVVDRLSDLFGLAPYADLYLIDVRNCRKIFTDNHQTEFVSHLQGLQVGETHLSSHLFNEDCVTALMRLPSNSIDFCFADPPYNLKKQYDRWNDSLESIEYFEWCDRWLSELCRVLKPGCTLAVLNIPHWAVRHYQFLASRMQFQTWIAWEGLSFPVRMIMPAHYAILCFSKGSPRSLPGLSEQVSSVELLHTQPLKELYCLRSSCINKRNKLGIVDRTNLTDLWCDIHRLKHNSRRVNHPCQLPPSLMRRLFALFTEPDEVVLDCFNGAGTSTLVAHQMKRRFIGIEISEQYHQLAIERHRQLEEGIDPFAKVSNVPSAKNSPVQRLPKQKYQVSKKVLQLEVKRIAKEMGRLPTRNEVEEFSRFSIKYFDAYFTSWGEVCAAARTTGMKETLEENNQSTQQLLIPFKENKS